MKEKLLLNFIIYIERIESRVLAWLKVEILDWNLIFMEKHDFAPKISNEPSPLLIYFLCSPNPLLEDVGRTCSPSIRLPSPHTHTTFFYPTDLTVLIYKYEFSLPVVLPPMLLPEKHLACIGNASFPGSLMGMSHINERHLISYPWVYGLLC